MSFQIKRVYDTSSANDGQRVLVDRLWPRGLRKADAHLTLWMKDVAPSPALRIWLVTILPGSLSSAVVIDRSSRGCPRSMSFGNSEKGRKLHCFMPLTTLT